MSVEEIERMLKHKHAVDDRKRYRELKEQDLESDWDDVDLPHEIKIQLHKR